MVLWVSDYQEGDIRKDGKKKTEIELVGVKRQNSQVQSSQNECAFQYFDADW